MEIGNIYIYIYIYIYTHLVGLKSSVKLFPVFDINIVAHCCSLFTKFRVFALKLRIINCVQNYGPVGAKLFASTARIHALLVEMEKLEAKGTGSASAALGFEEAPAVPCDDIWWGSTRGTLANMVR